jgi:hypothetical protein
MAAPQDMKRYTAVALTCLVFAAVVTPVRFADAQSSRPSSRLCDSYARDYAERNSRQGKVLGGAAKGSLLGAGIGALAGGAGAGAAIGATVGVIGGGARRRGDMDRMYNAAYQDCMAGRVR